MDKKIQELIDLTNEKFGLRNYRLERYSLYRKVNVFNDTVYTMVMEWFPKHVTTQEDDDSNPEGTAVVEINVHDRKFLSAIFVRGKTYATDGVMFTDVRSNNIIRWIEDETGLVYGEQFQLDQAKERDFLFKECINGIAISPSGLIQVTCNQEGKLISFSAHGQFPPTAMIREESYTLSLDKIKHLAMEQLKLIEFPSNKDETLVPVYAIEEIFVQNDGKSTIPYEVFSDTRSYLKIDQTLCWDDPIDTPFERQEVSWMEEVTWEQVWLSERSPDSFPITTEEQTKCLVAVKNLLRQQYPNDSDQWMVKTLHRDQGHIYAVLRMNNQVNRVFQRKLTIIIDTGSYQAVNYMDNESMLNFFDPFKVANPVSINKEEAYDNLLERIELTPCYVYDFEQKQFILYGKLDCHYAVNAGSGEVISLATL
ncbi:hypothetical protein [Paenibacillus assamensis]|uniref:hypothetical protein n=1 Tax=Paenibacillus assamensis TaxID=311244 RepID=UPI0004099530|nr:hypothetical protein [Paenibacillus assamensis]